jgi:hypothetical protein
MDIDIESERLGRLAEAREDLANSDGVPLEKSFGPGSVGNHELLDRAFMVSENWESFVASHPATLLDAERYRKAREIADAMADFYQMVGRGEASSTS